MGQAFLHLSLIKSSDDFTLFICVWRSFMSDVWRVNCIYCIFSYIEYWRYSFHVFRDNLWNNAWKTNRTYYIVYLNDLFRNNYPSSAEMLEAKGHILGIIPKDLAQSQAHKCFVEKNVEKKLLEIMDISDLDGASKLGCPLTTKLFTHILVSFAQDRTLGLKRRVLGA